MKMGPLPARLDEATAALVTETVLCWLLLISSKKHTNLPLQLPGHLTPESHIKSSEGEDPCSCSQKLLCRKAPICLACSMERQK